VIPEPVLRTMKDRWAPRPPYQTEPELWAQDRAPSIELWSKQREIMRSVVTNRNTAVKSCHSAGKSFTAAFTTSWWIDAHPPGEAFVVTSAPTGVQVKAILWREITRMHSALELPGRTNQVEWYLGDELVAFGRKPSEYEPTAFQGIHALHVLVILDEACGIPASLWEAASSLTSNENGRILAIGNPDDPASHFAEVCQRDTWHTITISAFDTPNFTDEPVSDRLRSLLVSRQWVEEKKIEWTESSPLYVSKVTGEFPTDAQDGVVPNSWAQQCMYLDLTDADGERHLGVDVAAGGGDKAVAWLRAGRKAVRKWELVGEDDPLRFAEWVRDIVLENDVTTVKVDSIGVGWGVCGILDGWHKDGVHDAVVVPVAVSEKADDEEHFLNLRAEIWWAARERSRKHEWDLGELTDDDVAELTAPRYHTRNPRARIQVEKKDEIRKRLGKSPDSADALLLAFHEASFAATIAVPTTAGGTSVPRRAGR